MTGCDNFTLGLVQIMSHDFNEHCSVNMMCQSDDTVTPHGGIPALVIKYTTGMKFRVHDLRDAVELLDMQQGKLVFRGKLLFLAERLVDKSKARAGAASSAYSGNLCCCCQAAT